MHYFAVVIIPSSSESEDFETVFRQKVADLLADYYYEKQVEPYRRRLDVECFQRMCEYYKTTDLQTLLPHFSGWDFDAVDDEVGIDEEGLYGISIFNPKAKWDGYELGGRWNGTIRNSFRALGRNEKPTLVENYLPVKLLDHVVTCHAVITPDGEWHEVQDWNWGSMIWDESRRKEYDEWYKKERARWNVEASELIMKYPDCILVGVDYHV